ncbi:sensor domain-containing protein [Kitasatospora sp. NPDC004615]|uniref:sensor domain-containing protein n=1 Tax=Kitasatospora sp. NPDC004615 TaxID=3364017 RepID=UPI0036D1D5FC
MSSPMSSGSEAKAPGRSGRWRLIGAGAALLVAVAAGVAWWLWRANDASPRVVAGTVQAVVLPADEVSKAVGSTLNEQTRASEPAPPLPADPPGCSVAVGPTTTVVYQGGWTAFVSVAQQDSAASADHTATQTVGRYATADLASEVFGTLADGLKACTAAVRDASGANASRWTYRVDSATDTALTWTATQDHGDGWACYREARLAGSTVLQSAVCQAGDGRPAARALADRMAERAK